MPRHHPTCYDIIITGAGTADSFWPANCAYSAFPF